MDNEVNADVDKEETVSSITDLVYVLYLSSELDDFYLEMLESSSYKIL